MFLVEDSIVRSTTMKVLLGRIRDLGRGPRDPCAGRLSPDHRPVCLWHRHAAACRSCSRGHGGALTDDIQANMCRTGPRTRSAICRS